MAWNNVREVKGSAGEAWILDCGDLRFNTGSVYVRPKAMRVLAKALIHAQENPDQQLLILSHTDKVGDPASNKALSADRAKSVLLLLGGGPSANAAENEKAWVDLVLKRKSAQDVKDLLEDYGKPDVKALEGEVAHVLEKKDVVPDDKVDAQLWSLIYQASQRRIAGYLLSTPRKLGELCAKLTWANADARAIGCGEKYPVQKTEGASERNRRTEFVFFPAGATVPNEAELGKLYDGSYAITKLDCFDDDHDLKLPVPTEENCIFLLDVSASMTGMDGLEKNRLDRLRPRLIEQMEAYVAGADATHVRRMACIIFGLNVPADSKIKTWNQCLPWMGPKVTTILLGSDPRMYLPLYPANAETMAGMKAFLLEQAPSGGTPTRSALELAFSAAFSSKEGDAPKSCRVVLYSDGVPAGDPIEIGNAVQSWRKKANPPSPHTLKADREWPVDTFGFSTCPGFNFLNRLSVITRGDPHLFP